MVARPDRARRRCSPKWGSSPVPLRSAGGCPRGDRRRAPPGRRPGRVAQPGPARRAQPLRRLDGQQVAGHLLAAIDPPTPLLALILRSGLQHPPGERPAGRADGRPAGRRDRRRAAGERGEPVQAADRRLPRAAHRPAGARTGHAPAARPAARPARWTGCGCRSTSWSAAARSASPRGGGWPGCGSRRPTWTGLGRRPGC